MPRAVTVRVVCLTTEGAPHDAHAARAMLLLQHGNRSGGESIFR